LNFGQTTWDKTQGAIGNIMGNTLRTSEPFGNIMGTHWEHWKKILLPLALQKEKNWTVHE
jgi:hypothetical protein